MEVEEKKFLFDVEGNFASAGAELEEFWLWTFYCQCWMIGEKIKDWTTVEYSAALEIVQH